MKSNVIQTEMSLASQKYKWRAHSHTWRSTKGFPSIVERWYHVQINWIKLRRLCGATMGGSVHNTRYTYAQKVSHWWKMTYVRLSPKPTHARGTGIRCI